ncbi:hypothetical protein OIE63_39350 (plasmid) [Streptomyces sp. NBC_01795]|uniref:hypothetical protein n=1 Tax=unclassified Streptomyces TaxID=2593676 RepID=UPI002DDC836C|nr:MULTISPECIES: hypothetical protein [unclassified Streptomyces]WSA97582.1 hypothetical protein OIE63_39350 [Streptomyces sp. NBC_01795]WSB82170.1 hypothetical protein OHB04_41465 [Streptomyces sp. NBC_01775]WSS18141.1 hypothetical protein OG533_40545 [Streptomyces sp. NBC_01186]
MTETEHDLHERHKGLARALADQHARVGALGSGDAVTDEAFDALVGRAEELLAFEQQMPAKLAEPQRLRSEKVIFWSWRAQSGVAAALIAAVFLFGHTAWWLALIIPHALATLTGWSLKASPKEHKARRKAAIGLHLVGVLLVLVTLGVLSAWFIIAVLFGWAVVGIASADEQGAVK